MTTTQNFKKKQILNLGIHSISLQELLENLDEGIVFTPNIDHLMKLQKDAQFYCSYQQATWLLCDSKYVNLAARFLGSPFKQVIPGSSLLPAFYNYHKNNPNIKIFLLGAAEGVAIKAMETINQKLGRNIVVEAHSPSFGFEKNELEINDIICKINESGANVLVVGVGAPKQENWIVKYRSKLISIKIFMALGATIDFEAGTINRAPIVFQKLALEWLYRIIKEPKRLWKRYLIDDMPFFWLVLKQKLKRYKNPIS